jgi:phospho-N-acetylmuramoyl-pentapeptide-transferase
MNWSLLLAVISFGLAMGFGPYWLRYVRDQQFGKQLNPSEVNPDNPEEHAGKEGTPTLGGIIFVAPIVATTLAFQVLRTGRLVMLLPVVLALGLAALGAYDDMQTLVGRQRNAGLSPTAKWAAQILLCAGAVVALWWFGYAQVHVPFLGDFDLTDYVWLYVPFALFVMLATINGVAITDGMDSLLGTTAAVAFTAFWAIGLIPFAGAEGPRFPLTAALCATIVGALLAYLWFNAYPAQIWMGDTGSLALGGLLAAVALLEREPFLVLPIGIIFVANAGSTILQVLTNKLTSKRMFRITPLHHHFRRDSKGDRWVNWPAQAWTETQVVQRFWIVGAIGAIVGVALAVR